MSVDELLIFTFADCLVKLIIINSYCLILVQFELFNMRFNPNKPASRLKCPSYEWNNIKVSISMTSPFSTTINGSIKQIRRNIIVTETKWKIFLSAGLYEAEKSTMSFGNLNIKHISILFCSLSGKQADDLCCQLPSWCFSVYYHEKLINVRSLGESVCWLFCRLRTFERVGVLSV